MTVATTSPLAAVSDAGKCSATIDDRVGGEALDKQVVQYIADSAATCNMTPDADGLTHYRECSRPLGLANGEEISRALHGSLFWFCTDCYGFQEPRVQMVRGYGFHIIAVGARMVPEKLGLLRSGYGSYLSLRFGYSPVYDSRLSLRGGFGPVCIQHLSSRTATSPMPSTLGMHSLLRTNSSIFLHPPSPQQPPLVPIAHPGGIGCVFLAAQQ